MNKTIIFDLGGVLIDWNPRYLYTRYFETSEAIEHFLSQICTMEWNEEQDGGRPIKEANKLLIEKYPEYTKEILAYYGEWEDMLKGQIIDTVQILRGIRQSHDKVYALTNWSAETFPIALKHFNFLAWFDGILVSGQEKLKKPDPEIYKLLLKKYDLTAGNCLFIDDSARNVEAAIKEGIPSIQYKHPAQLKEQLFLHGIKI
jgi:2-haloacid dehalogenase